MKRRQRESIAKYLYDVSKITLTVTVLGNIASKERFQLLVLIWGFLAAFTIFLAAYLIEGTITEE
ncbi:MAG: hypothetical protein HYZ93_05630 [Candidatus Omnitrophica bacterium]|nr:hypothetical protein [Candidatus Omnitrophota bacterium]